MGSLTAFAVKNAKPGRHADGKGHLLVKEPSERAGLGAGFGLQIVAPQGAG